MMVIRPNINLETSTLSLGYKVCFPVEMWGLDICTTRSEAAMSGQQTFLHFYLSNFQTVITGNNVFHSSIIYHMTTNGLKSTIASFNK